jgi:glutathione synthase/RimK-type ligase-like ATP-grasp enzyme
VANRLVWVNSRGEGTTFSGTGGYDKGNSEMKPLHIAVGVDDAQWCQRFAAALDEKRNSGYPLRYDIVDLMRHDWLRTVAPYDAVLWYPGGMGVEGATHVKEKIYFLEKHLHKLVVPNFHTMWHFESKVAQSYLFETEGITTPATSVSFCYEDALDQLQSAQMPLVFKRSHGAASKNVRLVRSTREAMRWLRRAFCGQLYHGQRVAGRSRWQTVWWNLGSRWFWEFLSHQGRGVEPAGYVYWQELVPGNNADLRITVIGDRYAYGFWRHNRPHDFRASGSGRIDFNLPIPEEPLRYCIELNRRLDFDSMAYDILFKGSQFVINEISYGYLDSAPYRAAGHYELNEGEKLVFVEGHLWPQSLWAEWLLHRAEKIHR